jgi:nucleotidyltransferase/DNA polymerase involved in DNA repair
MLWRRGRPQARKRCPELILVSGEDLTPYRRASKAILAVLSRYGSAERLGLDEVRLCYIVSQACFCVLAMRPGAALMPLPGFLVCLSAWSLA